MSLQIWLPLDGSLENKGLLDFSIINKGSMVGFLNNGKIGQCLGQTTVSSAGRYLDIYNESLDNILTLGAFSVSCWVRLTNNVSSGFPICLGNRETSATRNSLFWNRGSTQGGSGTARFVVDCDTNGHSIISGTDSIANEENPQWHHIAFTIDKTHVKTNENEYNGTLYLKCYVDGIKSVDQSYTYSELSYDFKVVSGNKICFDTYVANFNDFRFYNHILSDKEVKEISKGLILHYKFDDKYIESTTNLLPASLSYPEMGNANYYHEGETWAGSPFGTSQLVAVTPGKYTYSCYIINNTSKNVQVALRAFSSTTYNTTYALTSYIKGNFINSNSEGWSVVNCDFSDLENIKTVLVTFTSSGNVSSVGSDFQVQYAQLEAKDHSTPWVLGGTSRNETTVYDSSGYEHNGNITDTININSDTPRYSCSTEADGTVTPVNISTMFDSTKLSSEFTLSTWVYNATTLRDANRYFYNGIIRMGFSTSYWVILSWIHCNADLSYNAQNSWSAAGESYSYTKDEWCHISLTFKDGVLKYYRNGLHIVTSDRSDTGQFIRGQFNTDAKLLHNWNGRLSDFRIYCTALSDDDIKELYNTSVSIDNKGNVHAREFIEKNQSSITKQGQYINSEISEMKNAGMAGTENYIQASISSQLSTGNYLYEI